MPGCRLDRAFELLVGLPIRVRRQPAAGPARPRGGKALSQALAEHPKHFDRLYVNMVRAGEAKKRNALAGAGAHFAEFQERSAELRSSVQSALLYPIVLVGVAGVAVLTMIFSWCPRSRRRSASSARRRRLPPRTCWRCRTGCATTAGCC